MKDDLFKETAQLNFKGKDSLIYEESERLLIKGVETLWR